MEHKRTMRHRGLETSKYIPFGILLDIRAVLSLLWKIHCSQTLFTCKHKPPLNLKNNFVNWLVGLWYVCVSSSIFTPTFLCEYLAVLEPESRYSYVLILECCCSKLRTSREQRWNSTSEGYLLLFPEVRWGNLILLFCLLRKKLTFISSEANSQVLRRRDSQKYHLNLYPPMRQHLQILGTDS